jgi:hypothetical protein
MPKAYQVAQSTERLDGSRDALSSHSKLRCSAQVLSECSLAAKSHRCQVRWEAIVPDVSAMRSLQECNNGDTDFSLSSRWSTQQRPRRHWLTRKPVERCKTCDFELLSAKRCHSELVATLAGTFESTHRGVVRACAVRPLRLLNGSAAAIIRQAFRIAGLLGPGTARSLSTHAAGVRASIACG